MFKNKVRTFEFLTLFTMVIGTVIGSGIFMKNNQLLTQTGNPIIAIILWLVVGIVTVMTVYAFVEIASSTRHFGNGTPGNWTKLFISRKLASFFNMFYITLYVPVCQSVFTAGFISFFFLAVGVYISVVNQLIIFLIVGIVLIAGFATLNALKPTAGKGIQIFGTIFKFIPLIIALVAGFFLIDKTAGANGTSTIWNGTGVGTDTVHPWDASSFDISLFIRGFGAILFAFDGFIYIVNAQKTAKHKDVVPKALVCGMLFAAIFYVIMAISLFLGSEDGSIVKILEKVFSGNNPQNETAQKAAAIVSNVLLMIICLIGINLFTYFGIIDLESGADAKLVYSKKRNIDLKRAAFLQCWVSVIVYGVLILCGALIPRGDFGGIQQGLTKIDPKTGETVTIEMVKYLQLTTNSIAAFVNTISSAASTVGFFIVATILVAAVFNRKTQKVKVERIKGFTPVAIISAVLIYLFVIAGIFSFILPTEVLTGRIKWENSDGLYFLILLIIGLSSATIGFFAQEKKFKKDPYKNGFDGYLSLEANPQAKVKSPVIK